MLRALRTNLLSAPVLASSAAVVNYLFAHMAHQPFEQVRALFLDARNRLLGDEVVALGDSDRAPLSARVIVRRALELNSCGIVVAHNHPSGDPVPSAEDIRATARLAEAAAALGIDLLDHLVIARGGWVSFRTMGLMEATRPAS